ncbi:hypothetical protein EAF04_005470 [Stromatinia cepivora]|nr:hypothetical protein EAF04_005470 [Stromatinia cepivora]
MATPSSKEFKVLPFMLESARSVENKTNLYEGPTAIIIIGPPGHSTRYCIPQALLCHHSRFFDRALNGYFKESIENQIELPEETPGEFELLLQWMYSKRIPEKPAIEGIKTIITFYIIADKFDVAGPHFYADLLLRIFLATPQIWYHACKTNGSLIYSILQSVYQLPKGHRARRIFGLAGVRPYLICESLIKEHSDTKVATPFALPGSSWLDIKGAFDTIDGLAIEVLKALGEMVVSKHNGFHQDPVTEEMLQGRDFVSRASCVGIWGY